MKKIPTLFERDPEDRRHVTDNLTQGCEWVINGEGMATRKYDGTCVMFDRSGTWWARREVKPGKPQPESFLPAQLDDVTGKIVGWEPIEQSSFYKFFREVLERVGATAQLANPGTYELCGPKINGNPEGYPEHVLISHAIAEEVRLGADDTWSFEKCRTLLTDPAWTYEGIVWHHPDGRMAKLKARDFA